jgi:hypothetical protein
LYFVNCNKLLRVKQIFIERADLNGDFSGEEVLASFPEIWVPQAGSVDQKRVQATGVVTSATFIVIEYDLAGPIKNAQIKKFEYQVRQMGEKSELAKACTDLFRLMGTFDLRNEIVLTDTLVFRDNKVPCKIVLELILLPKTLEISHLLFREGIIATKYKKLPQISEMNDFRAFKNEFWSAEDPGNVVPLRIKAFLDLLQEGYPTSKVLDGPEARPSRNGHKNQNYWSYVDLFAPLSTQSFEFGDLFGDVAKRFKKDIKNRLNVPQELFCRCLSGLSPIERLFVAQCFLKGVFGNWVSDLNVPTSLKFDSALMIHVNKEISAYLASNPHFKRTNEFLLRSILFDLVLQSQQNLTLGKPNPFSLSEGSIRVVAKTVQYNCHSIGYEHLKRLCFSRVLMDGAVFPGDDLAKLADTTRNASYFRIMLKHMEPATHRKLQDLIMPIGLFISDVTRNSLERHLDVTSFNLYSDFKQLVSVIYLTKECAALHKKKLRSLGIRVATVLDFLFVIKALAANVGSFLDPSKPQTLIERMAEAVRRETADLPSHLLKVLDALETLSHHDYFFEDFKVVYLDIQKHLESKTKGIRQLGKVFKELDVTEKNLQTIIKYSLLDNQDWKDKARSLFTLEPLKVDETKTSTTDNSDQSDDDQTVVQSAPDDIFFDVLQDFEAVRQPEFVVDRKPLQPWMSALVCLSGLNSDCVLTFTYRKNLVSDLNSIYELTFPEFKELLAKFISTPLSNSRGVYMKVGELLEGKRFSWMAFIVIMMVASFWKHPAHLRGKIEGLIQDISQVYGDRRPLFLDQVAESVLTTVANVLPTFMTVLDIDATINSRNRNGLVYVESALIDLEVNILEVTRLCNEHLRSYQLITGKPGIMFGTDFCRDLAVVFSKMLQKGTIVSHSISDFTMGITVRVRDVSHRRDIRFRISFGPPIAIISQQLSVVHFEEVVGPQSWLDRSALDPIFQQLLPSAGYVLSKTPKVFSEPVGRKVEVHFIHKGKKFIEFTLTVDVWGETRAFLNPKKWVFEKSPNVRSTAEVAKKFYQISYGALFLPIHLLVNHLEVIAFEVLGNSDLVWFISANNDAVQVSTGGRPVLPQGFLAELLPLQPAESAPLIITATYD